MTMYNVYAVLLYALYDCMRCMRCMPRQASRDRACTMYDVIHREIQVIHRDFHTAFIQRLLREYDAVARASSPH